MNAGFGARFFPEDFLVALFAAFLRAAGRFAVFLADFFLPAVFFLVAIASLPLGENRAVPRKRRNYRVKQYTDSAQLQ